MKDKNSNGAEKRRAYFFERYNRIAGAIGERFDGVETVTQYDPESNLVYKVIFNPKRAMRLGGQIPGFQDSIRDFVSGKDSNIIFYDEYWPYIVAANPVPIEYGALTIIRAQRDSDVLAGKMNTVNNEVDEVSLEALLRLSNEIGVRLWHNMDGVGASKLEAHWQGIVDSFQTEFAKKQELNRHFGVYTMKDYAGDNAVFVGEDKVANALKFARFIESASVDKRRIPYSVSLANNEIYVIPVRNDGVCADLGLDPKGRIAGCELNKCIYVALNADDFEKVKQKHEVTLSCGEKVRLSAKSIIQRTLYEKGKITSLANFLLKAA